MKNLTIVIILLISSCRANDPNQTSKLQFTKPVNAFLDKRPLPQLSNIEPAAGPASLVDKNNLHLNPQNYIYWQNSYYK